MENNKRKELIRSIKFTLFSLSAGLIQIVSYTLLFELLHLPAWISYLVSLILSVIWNFTLNRKFTFQSAASVPIAMLKVAGFYLVFTPLSTWWTKVLTEDCLWNPYVVQIGTMAVNLITEFLFQRFVVFGKSLDTAK